MSASSERLISVVMPVLAPRSEHLRQAVLSVLRQTHANLELIVVEDPSDHPAGPLLAELAEPRLRHILNPERTSLVEQRNRGMSEARGELVALLDADDMAEPRRLAVQAAFLDANPDVAVVGSQLRIIDGDGVERGFRAYPLDHESIVAALPRYNAMPQPAVMLRAHAFAAVGGYRWAFRDMNEDYELWSRMAKSGLRFANLAEPLTRYRVHPSGSKTAKLRGMIQATLEVKRLHWRGHMNARAQARMAAERLLLVIPPRWVLALFQRIVYRADLPGGASRS
jgi:glycosyltransferase involved in cell wall biosynthesis